MTEDEARTKRCGGPSPQNCGTPAPMHEHPDNVQALRDRPQGRAVIYLCSASDCMSWRKIKETVHRYIYDEEDKKKIEAEGLTIEYQLPMDPEYTCSKITGGFCGLGGKP